MDRTLYAMGMESRNQYIKALRKEYLKTKSRKGKSKLLNEAVKRTKLNRKYLMEKLKPTTVRLFIAQPKQVLVR